MGVFLTAVARPVPYPGLQSKPQSQPIRTALLILEAAK